MNNCENEVTGEKLQELSEDKPNSNEPKIKIELEELTVSINGKLITVLKKDIIEANLQNRWSIQRITNDEDLLKLFLFILINN